MLYILNVYSITEIAKRDANDALDVRASKA